MNAQNKVFEVQTAARLDPIQNKCVMSDLI